MKLCSLKHANAFLFLCVFTFTFAQDNDPGKWTPEDIINTEYMGSVKISPDNNMIVWTKRKAVKDKDQFVSDIYLTRLDVKDKDGFKTIQLTNAKENDYAPFFSKDGEYIYFQSSREKGKKLWKMSIFGGEPQAVHEFKNGISSIQWKDKNTLLYRSNEGQTLYEQKLKELKDNVQVIEDTIHWKPSRVYAFDLKTKKSKRITNNKKPLTSFTVSPDGNWLVFSEARNISFAADAQKDPFTFLMNLKTGETARIIADRGTPTYSVKFSKDNNGFYFTSSKTSAPEWNGAGATELFYFNLAQMKYSQVNLGWEMGIGLGYEIVGNNVLVTLANKTYYKLGYYKKGSSSWSKQYVKLGEKDNHTRILAVSDDGNNVIYQYSTASKMPKYYVANLSGSSFSYERELVKLNKKLSKKSITKSEVLLWKGANDDEVTGILYYPENYEEGKKYPLVLSIHGGPTGVDTDTWSERWSTYPNILAQRGAFVLKPNYHGSGNHGQEWAESIKQNYNKPELEDIYKAIQKLNDEGKIDMDKLGTMGWSNGAIISTALTIKYPNLFKFAAAGAGDVNWTSDYGTCRFGVSFDQYYIGGAPWDDVDGKSYNERYITESFIFEIEKIKTPTIIFHGSEDRAVPRDQGWEYYRGLQQAGNTPVRFLWFPGQPHGLGKITHQVRKMKEELKWIDTYLFEKEDKTNEAFKKGSPLDKLLKIEKAKVTANGNFGLEHEGTLIPEVLLIKKDSIAISKFEVTNAQFSAFDSNFNFDAGMDNYPAVVSKQQANNYVQWLSEITGKTYRLPNQKEAEKLHKSAHKAAAKENTLNYWAGYNITIDEVPAFRQKLSEVQSHLLKKVGKYTSTKVGKAVVYDLGGNVAEYYSEGIYGYSAYDFYDAASDKMIESKHVGIRVIKE